MPHGGAEQAPCPGSPRGPVFPYRCRVPDVACVDVGAPGGRAAAPVAGVPAAGPVLAACFSLAQEMQKSSPNLPLAQAPSGSTSATMTGSRRRMAPGRGCRVMGTAGTLSSLGCVWMKNEAATSGLPPTTRAAAASWGAVAAGAARRTGPCAWAAAHNMAVAAAGDATCGGAVAAPVPAPMAAPRPGLRAGRRWPRSRRSVSRAAAHRAGRSGRKKNHCVSYAIHVRAVGR